MFWNKKEKQVISKIKYPIYWIGQPELSGGIKFYPLMARYSNNIYSMPNIVEYYDSKEEAEIARGLIECKE